MKYVRESSKNWRGLSLAEGKPHFLNGDEAMNVEDAILPKHVDVPEEAERFDS